MVSAPLRAEESDGRGRCWSRSIPEPDGPDVPGELCDHPVSGLSVRALKTIPEIIALFFLMQTSPFKKIYLSGVAFITR
jgi:hypothetical protein